MRISIVTPSFNHGPYLEQAITSVLGQKDEDLEYVLIDGESTDQSLEIIKKYEHSLAYWVSEKDRGHGDALNKGFSKTTGEIMAWINSDDMYTPWSFTVVREIFRKFPHVMWVVGFNSWWSSQGAMTRASRVPKNIFDYLKGDYAWIQQESVFWRRSLWERAGGYIDDSYSLMVDGELWTRFFLHAPLHSVDCVLGGYRSHGKNRALLHTPQCRAEMERAIAVMKTHCDKGVIRNSDSAAMWSRLTNVPCVGGKIGQLARLLQPQLFGALDYDNIFWDGVEWGERRLPFRL